METPIPAVSEALLEPQSLVGYRYRVEGLHRRHPLGELYRCVDETGHRVVLLHRLRREFGEPGVLDRLFETGPLDRANRAILEICDYGRDLDDRPYLVSPWRDGAALADLDGPWSFPSVLAVARLICLALSDAHAGGRIHGGLEPSSVIVSPALADEGIALIGFGLAAALDAGGQHGRRLSLVAAPSYAAPELIRGDLLGPASDVYALGVLVWELLCGAPPFRGPTSGILEGHLGRALPRFRPRVGVPEGFERVLRRMLARDPADRFANAREVLAQLEVFAAFEPPEHSSESGDGDDVTVILARPRLAAWAPARSRESGPAPAATTPSSPWRQRARAFLLGIAGMSALVLALSLTLR